MNEKEELITIEEEIMLVIQKVDEMVDEKLQSGEINTEQYLKLSQEIQTYADKSKNVIALLRTQLVQAPSNIHLFIGR